MVSCRKEDHAGVGLSTLEVISFSTNTPIQKQKSGSDSRAWCLASKKSMGRPLESTSAK